MRYVHCGRYGRYSRYIRCLVEHGRAESLREVLDEQSDRFDAFSDRRLVRAREAAQLEEVAAQRRRVRRVHRARALDASHALHALLAVHAVHVAGQLEVIAAELRYTRSMRYTRHVCYMGYVCYMGLRALHA